MDKSEIGEHELSSFVNLKEAIKKKLESSTDITSVDGTIYAMALLSNISDPYLIKSNPSVEIPAMMECVELLLNMKLPESIRLPLESLKNKDIEGFRNQLMTNSSNNTAQINNASSNSGCMAIVLILILATYIFAL